MAKAKLTPIMERALVAMAKADGKIYRWPGGYWMTSERPADWPAEKAPEGYFSTQTIYGLYHRGLLDITARMSRGDAWVMALNGAGQSAGALQGETTKD